MTIESLIRFNFVVEAALNWEYDISKHIVRFEEKNVGWTWVIRRLNGFNSVLM